MESAEFTPPIRGSLSALATSAMPFDSSDTTLGQCRAREPGLSPVRSTFLP